MPRVKERAPEWLIDIAEALAGQRLNEQGQLEPVSLERLIEARRRPVSNLAGDPYSRWRQWFFGQIQSRMSLAPASRLTEAAVPRRSAVNARLAQETRRFTTWLRAGRSIRPAEQITHQKSMKSRPLSSTVPMVLAIARPAIPGLSATAKRYSSLAWLMVLISLQGIASAEIVADSVADYAISQGQSELALRLLQQQLLS